MNFLEFAEKVLREEKKPLTPNEIWEIGKAKGYDKELNSTGKTPWSTLAARLYVDIRDNAKTKFTKLTLDRTRFFLKDLLEGINVDKLDFVKTQATDLRQPTYKEKELHKYLSYFVYNFKFIYTKTITHEESSKAKYAQWLHPDVVGVYYPFKNWLLDVVDISKELGIISVKLYSFEIKRELNFNNLRESFFQAVSNSSWAHEGYLCAAEIEKDEDFLHELARLTSSFGIGVIRLDVEDPDASEILFPAREKDVVDIETINKIAEINPSFKEFIKRVKHDLATKEIRIEKYDKILTREELANGKGLRLK